MKTEEEKTLSTDWKTFALKASSLKNVIYVSKFISTQQNYDLTASKS